MEKAKRLLLTSIILNFLLWNWLMPVMEPADESGHYEHVLYLLKNKQLPDLTLGPEGDQTGIGYTTYPPLYYLSLIPLATLIDAPTISAQPIRYHPQRQAFKQGVFALYYHDQTELLFRWNQLIRSVHAFRLQSSLYVLIAIYLVYLTGQNLFGKNSWRPLTATALVSFNPMLAHLSNSVININLNILLFSSFFFLAVADLRKQISPRRFFVYGALTGAAYLTKVTGLTLIPITLGLLIIHPQLRQLRPSAILQPALSYLFGFLAVAGWYLGWNQLKYGSWLAAEAILKYFARPVGQQAAVGPLNYWIGFFQTGFRTLFSGYGMITVHLPGPILYGLFILVMLASWGLLLKLKKDFPFQQLSLKQRQWYFLFGSALVILAGHFWVNTKLEVFQARDLFVGLVPFSILLITGLETFIQKLANRQLWQSSRIKLLIIGIIYGLSFFQWQQILIVKSLKQTFTGQPTALASLILPATIWLAILWLAVNGLKNRGPNLAKALLQKTSRQPSRWSQSLILVLLAINLSVLAFLVIPQLYF